MVQGLDDLVSVAARGLVYFWDLGSGFRVEGSLGRCRGYITAR